MEIIEDRTLTLEQIQGISTDELINLYRNGYSISENTDIYSLSAESPQIRSLQAGSHYTWTDVGIIAAAIGISVVIIGGVTYLIIQREKEKLMSEIKETISSSVQKVGLLERLIPIAEKIGKRLTGESKAQ